MANPYKGDVLAKKITEVIKNYKSVNKAVHECFISALNLAASSGQNGQLNRLFKAMTVNDQRAMRVYVDRTHFVLGVIAAKLDPANVLKQTLTKDEIQAYKDRGKFMAFGDGEFRVIKDKDFVHAKENKAAFVELAPKLMTPSGIHKRFNERDTIDEMKTFGNDEVFKQLTTLRNLCVDGSKSKKVTVSVDDKLKGIVSKAFDEAQSLMESLDLEPPADNGTAPQPATMH